jgi:hypothetical protein
MNTVFSTSMRKATQLTRGQNVIEATRVIQRALLGRPGAFGRLFVRRSGVTSIELKANFAGSSGEFEQPRQDARIASAPLREAAAERWPTARAKRSLGEVLKLLRQADLPSLGLGSKPFEVNRGGQSGQPT